MQNYSKLSSGLCASAWVFLWGATLMTLNQKGFEETLKQSLMEKCEHRGKSQQSKPKHSNVAVSLGGCLMLTCAVLRH